MASSPLTTLAEVRALARLHPIPKSAVPALYWDGPTLSSLAYDLGSGACLGGVEYLDGAFHSQALDIDFTVPTGRRWRILGTYPTTQQARSALEADVAARCGLPN